MRPQLYRGKCKWFNSKKGFGFIIADNNEELFVHQTEIKAEGFRNLAENEEVEFEIEEGVEGRRKAIKVTGPEGACVKGDIRRPSLSNRGRPYSQSRSYYGGGYERGNDSSMDRNANYSHGGGVYNWAPSSSYGNNFSVPHSHGYDDHGDYEPRYSDRSHQGYNNPNGYMEHHAPELVNNRGHHYFSNSARDY